MSKVEWPYRTPGIPDTLFKRISSIPMTKQEVRTLSVSRLRIFTGAVIYDIGAGTGSVTVECALLAAPGTVYSLEQDSSADELVEVNVRRFGLTNVKLVPGSAPATMDKLPPADRVFIGGSAGSLADILKTVDKKLKPGGWVVANAVTLETGPVVLAFLEGQGYQQVEAISINVSRAKPVGRSHLWEAQNPVQIISGQKPG